LENYNCAAVTSKNSGMNEMVALAFGLELNKTCYLQLIFIRDILNAGEIRVTEEMLRKLSDVVFSQNGFSVSA